MNSVIEQVILDRLHTLDNSRLNEVLNFVEFLADRDTDTPSADKKVFHALRRKYRNLMSSSASFAEQKSAEKSLEEQFVKRNSL